MDPGRTCVPAHSHMPLLSKIQISLGIRGRDLSNSVKSMALGGQTMTSQNWPSVMDRCINKSVQQCQNPCVKSKPPANSKVLSLINDTTVCLCCCLPPLLSVDTIMTKAHIISWAQQDNYSEVMCEVSCQWHTPTCIYTYNYAAIQSFFLLLFVRSKSRGPFIWNKRLQELPSKLAHLVLIK